MQVKQVPSSPDWFWSVLSQQQKSKQEHWLWRDIPIIPTLGRSRLEDQKFKVILNNFEASLCYIRPCFKTNKRSKTKKAMETSFYSFERISFKTKCLHYFTFVCLCACIHVPTPHMGGQRATCRNQFSPSTLWIPGINSDCPSW